MGPAPALRRLLAAGLLLLGLGAALVAVLGPLVTGVIRYHASPGAIGQILGGDVAGLVLVAPLAVAASVLAWRAHPAAPLVGLGPALYGLYVYSQLALSGDLNRYPGNSERFFPLFLGLFLLAGGIVVLSSTAMASVRPPPLSRGRGRSLGVFLLVVALFLALGLHLPGLLALWRGSPTSEYLADPVIFWLVKFMDLGLVVPALVVVAVGILRHARWAHTVSYGVVGWVALLGSSVAGMAIVMQATGDPAGRPMNTLVFSLFALVALGLAVVTFLPVLRTSQDPGAGVHRLETATTARPSRASH